MFSFEDLQVYTKSLDFVKNVMDVIDGLDTPRKHFRIIEQLESCSTSIALNIAEGKGRHSKNEFKHFLYIARGSLFETVALLQILRKKEWLLDEHYESLYAEAEEVHRMLSGLINSI